MAHAYSLTWVAPDGGVDASCVRVSYSPSSARRPHASDERIEECWAAATAGNQRLFDGAKFRLHRVSDTHTAVDLQLGLTGYREYLGTNRRPPAEHAALCADGERDFRDSGAHLSNALGCEAVLITSDEQVVLLRRSAAVGTHSALYAT